MTLNFTKTNYKVLAIIAILLIASDHTFSWLEFYGQSLKGDLIPLVLPDETNAPVLQDPLGIQALQSGNYHPNINRYSSVASLEAYFKSVPFLLQSIVNPVESLYLSSSLIKFVVYLLFVLMLYRFTSISFKRKEERLLAILSFLPLLQIEGIFSVFNFVDSSVVYLFFYGLPYVLLCVFLFPLFKKYVTAVDPYAEKPYMYLLSFLIGIILLFSSALMSPTLLLIFGLYGLERIRNWYLLNQFHWNKWDSIFTALFPIACYSLLLGTFNSESSNNSITFLDRYAKLLEGMNVYFVEKPALLIVWIISLILYFMLKKQKQEIWDGKFEKLILFGLVFTILYLLLLPLGGYREYRPLILRYDTLIPVSLISILIVSTLFSHAILYTKGLFKTMSIILLLMTAAFYSIHEFNTFKRDKLCEQEILYKIHYSPPETKVITFSEEACYVMDWVIAKEPNYYINHSKMWKYWNINQNDILISFEKAPW